MEGVNNSQPQVEPSVQPNSAATQPAASAQPPAEPQSSINPNQPPVRRERRFQKFLVPILAIIAVVIVGLIIYLTLNVTGVIDTISLGDTSIEDEEDLENTPETTYQFETERMAKQADSIIQNGDFDSDEALAIQAELESYLENASDVDTYEEVIAATALARFYFAQEGRVGEGIELLETIAANENAPAEVKVYCYTTLYDHYVDTDEKLLQYDVLRRLMELPRDTTQMSYDYFPDIYDGYLKVYEELGKYSASGEGNVTTEDGHDS